MGYDEAGRHEGLEHACSWTEPPIGKASANTAGADLLALQTAQGHQRASDFIERVSRCNTASTASGSLAELKTRLLRDVSGADRPVSTTTSLCGRAQPTGERRPPFTKPGGCAPDAVEQAGLPCRRPYGPASAVPRRLDPARDQGGGPHSRLGLCSSLGEARASLERAARPAGCLQHGNANAAPLEGGLEAAAVRTPHGRRAHSGVPCRSMLARVSLQTSALENF